LWIPAAVQTKQSSCSSLSDQGLATASIFVLMNQNDDSTLARALLCASLNFSCSFVKISRSLPSVELLLFFFLFCFGFRMLVKKVTSSNSVFPLAKWLSAINTPPQQAFGQVLVSLFLIMFH
jgi:hypothetical protein